MAFNLRITETTLEKRLSDYLEEEKQGRDKKIRKMADILIKDELISFELSEKYIKDIRRHQSGDPFEELLLAFFLADAEEWEESIRSFGEILNKDFNREFKEDIRQLILLIRISELNTLPTAGELAGLLEAISSKENIVHILWKLNELLDAGKNPELFQHCVERAKELYPDAFRICNFQGWLFVKSNKIESAIDEFSKVLEGLLKEDPESPHRPVEMATVSLNLAECTLLLPGPDPGKAIEYCNAALEHADMTGDPMMEILTLLTRAKAYLLPGENRDQNRQFAQQDIHRILELDPQNREASKLLEQINE